MTRETQGQRIERIERAIGELIDANERTFAMITALSGRPASAPETPVAASESESFPVKLARSRVWICTNVAHWRDGAHMGWESRTPAGLFSPAGRDAHATRGGTFEDVTTW